MDTESTINPNSVFETKEQYVAFRQQWKKLHADGAFKKKPVPQHRYNYATHNIDVVGYHQESDMTAFHHMAFLVALGKDLNVSFGNVTKSYYPDTLPLYWALTRGEGALDVFGDTLTEGQRLVILNRINEFRSSLLRR